jgi:hypothetical protein
MCHPSIPSSIGNVLVKQYEAILHYPSLVSGQRKDSFGLWRKMMAFDLKGSSCVAAFTLLSFGRFLGVKKTAMILLV